MNKHVLVSIIMPVFNAERTIESSVRSVLNQTYKEIELIIVNDGSTDQTHHLCAQYVDDPRVIYYKQENKGPSAARNLGLSKIKGSYVMFIDSDDCFKSNAVEIMMTNAQDTDLVIAGYENTDPDSGKKDTDQITPGKSAGEYEKKAFLNQYGFFFESQLIHYIWHKLYRGDILASLTFEESLIIGEDLVFNLSYLDRIDKVTLIDSVVIEHVKDNQQSLTKTYQPNLLDYRKVIYLKSKAFLTANHKWTGKNEESLNRYFSKKLFTVLKNYYSPSAPLKGKEKRALSERLISDTLVQDLNPWFRRYSRASNLLGFLIMKKKIRLFTYSATFYFTLMSLIERKH